LDELQWQGLVLQVLAMLGYQDYQKEHLEPLEQD
jgi:hypothetical protein